MASTFKNLQKFHYLAMGAVVFVVTFVLYWMWWVSSRDSSWRKWKDHKWFEFFWCLISSAVLFGLALLSLLVLYVMDEMSFPMLCLKEVGCQWYWTYELSGLFSCVFSSDFHLYQSEKGYRMLDVD